MHDMVLFPDLVTKLREPAIVDYSGARLSTRVLTVNILSLHKKSAENQATMMHWLALSSLSNKQEISVFNHKVIKLFILKYLATQTPAESE